MREKIDATYEDDKGNTCTINADSDLSMSGEMEDPENKGKINYEYYFNVPAAGMLEEILRKEYGVERMIGDILAEEFDFAYGFGELHFYCERRGIPHSYDW